MTLSTSFLPPVSFFHPRSIPLLVLVLLDHHDLSHQNAVVCEDDEAMSSTVETEPSATSQTVSSSHDLLVLKSQSSFLTPSPTTFNKRQRGERERDRDVRMVVPRVEGKGLTGSVFVSVVGDEKGPLFQDPETNKQDAHLCSALNETQTRSLSFSVMTPDRGG